jgi:cytochrome c oxidase subunit 2
MKSPFKILAFAAAIAMAPSGAAAQHNPPVQPQLTQEQKAALPAQPEAISPPSAATSENPPAGAVAPAGLARPEAGVGMPTGGMQFQPQYTELGAWAAWFHNDLLVPIITAITLLVLGLMLYAIVRFRSAAHPTPSRTSHNTVIEVIWTLVPVLILVVIAVPSISLLAKQYSAPKADLTVKAIGHQWYWSYQYPDHGEFEIISNVLSDADAEARGEPRLLGVDERMVVPAGATVKLIVTSDDVVHSWGVPSFWVKIDAVPGRLNETWFKVDRPGIYYGQCFELCGARHAYMPIAVEVMPRAQFAAWVASKGGTMPVQSVAAGGVEGPGTTPPTSSDATANSPIIDPQAEPNTTGGTAATPAPATIVDATATPPADRQAATKNR